MDLSQQQAGFLGDPPVLARRRHGRKRRARVYADSGHDKKVLTVIAGEVGLLTVEARAVGLFLLGAIARPGLGGCVAVDRVCGALAFGRWFFLGIVEGG